MMMLDRLPGTKEWERDKELHRSLKLHGRAREGDADAQRELKIESVLDRVVVGISMFAGWLLLWWFFILRL